MEAEFAFELSCAENATSVDPVLHYSIRAMRYTYLAGSTHRWLATPMKPRHPKKSSRNLFSGRPISPVAGEGLSRLLRTPGGKHGAANGGRGGRVACVTAGKKTGLFTWRRKTI